MQEKVQKLRAGAWALSITVGIVAVLAWGAGVSWKMSHQSAYSIFPVFGLLAFSLMWAH